MSVFTVRTDGRLAFVLNNYPPLIQKLLILLLLLLQVNDHIFVIITAKLSGLQDLH